MRLIVVCIFLSSVLLPDICFSNEFCNQFNKVIDKKFVFFSHHNNIYKVRGGGQLQFYSAPDDRCVLKDTFVAPGNSLYVYSAFGGFYSVMYLTQDGDQIIGWVESQRLIETNKGITHNTD